MTGFFQILGVAQPWQLVGATMLFLMLPGPGTFCILTCSGRHGMRGGFTALAGLMLADVLLMLLAAIGVAALFKALQYAGAGYLCWLGLRLVIAKSDVASAVPFSRAADFRRGFLVTLVNPKAIVFYMAFFPLFIDPHLQRGAITFIAMVGLISCCTLFYGSLLVVGGNAAAHKLKQNRRVARLATKAAGVVLIGFGIKMTTN
jgi:leucine efflux protein